MSFGFSVGDIVLISEMTYKLYRTLTTGRKSASRGLKQLEQVLFGLRCALDHLRRQANFIHETTIDEDGSQKRHMKKDLDTMIQSCAETLMELEGVFAKFADAVEDSQQSLVDGEEGESRDVSAATTKKSALSTRSAFSRLQKTARINWLRIRWDIEGKTLTEYYVKLQAHTDAINLILVTFVWSATSRIESEGKVNTKKMLDLLENIRLAVDAPIKPPEQDNSAKLADNSAAARTNASKSIGMLHLAEIPPAAPKVNIVAPHNHSDVTGPASASDLHGISSGNTLHVEIAKVNNARAVIGKQEFEKFMYRGPQRGQHLPLKRDKGALTISQSLTPTMPKLQVEIKTIFSKLNCPTEIPSTNIQDLGVKDFVRWVQALEDLLESWASEYSVQSSKATKTVRQAEGLQFMVELNMSMERLSKESKRALYPVVKQSNLFGVFEKMKAYLCSVMVEKEIEEFEDEMEQCFQV